MTNSNLNSIIGATVRLFKNDSKARIVAFHKWKSENSIIEFSNFITQKLSYEELTSKLKNKFKFSEWETEILTKNLSEYIQYETYGVDGDYPLEYAKITYSLI